MSGNFFACSRVMRGRNRYFGIFGSAALFELQLVG